MQQAFEEASFDCPVGELYPKVVGTDSGYHLIYRIK
jgi:parvulin-like peptidyl-prolyl isomerase